MRLQMPWFSVISMCWLLALTGCASPKFYERDVQTAYDAEGNVRPGYATLNIPYLDAINEDLKACYAKKKP